MLLKIKAIFGAALIVGIGGFFTSLGGANYVEAFGPSVGMFAAGGVGFAVKESLPRITAYLSKAFGVKVIVDDGPQGIGTREDA